MAVVIEYIDNSYRLSQESVNGYKSSQVTSTLNRGKRLNLDMSPENRWAADTSMNRFFETNCLIRLPITNEGD